MWYLILLFVPFSSSQFYQEQFFGQIQPNNDPYAQLYSKYQNLLTRVEKLEQQVSGLQQAAHSDWNSTENGGMFKLFEERKNWDQAESYCRSLNAHLAVIDNKEKNQFIQSLINESPTSDFVWIGMKTKATTRGFTDSFSNFNEDSPIDGCAGISFSISFGKETFSDGYKWRLVDSFLHTTATIHMPNGHPYQLTPRTDNRIYRPSRLRVLNKLFLRVFKSANDLQSIDQ